MLINHLGVDDPKQVGLHAYPVSLFGAKKKMLQCCAISEVELVGKFDAILNLKLEETFEECVVNRLLHLMVVVVGTMLLK